MISYGSFGTNVNRMPSRTFQVDRNAASVVAKNEGDGRDILLLSSTVETDISSSVADCLLLASLDHAENTDMCGCRSSTASRPFPSRFPPPPLTARGGTRTCSFRLLLLGCKICEASRPYIRRPCRSVRAVATMTAVRSIIAFAGVSKQVRMRGRANYVRRYVAMNEYLAHGAREILAATLL